MNLSDILQVDAVEWKPKKAKKEVVEKAVKLKDRFEAIEGLFEHASNRDEQAHLRNLQNRIKDLFNTERAEILKEECTLPAQLLQKGGTDPLSLAAQTPKVTLTHLRQVADKLGFVAIPVDYLNKQSYEKEDFAVRDAISGFQKKLSPWFDIYVLTPVVYYSVENHIKATADLPIYAGPDCAQAFMAINITIPMFRSIIQNLDQVRERTNQLAQSQNKTNQELQNLARRVNELQAQVERQKREAVLQELRLKQMEEQVAAIRSQQRVISYDPVMFAIPKGKTINDEGHAILGPCWGPDFQDIVLTSLGFQGVPKQRELLEEKAQEWGDYSRNQRVAAHQRPDYNSITRSFGRSEPDRYFPGLSY